MEAVVLVIHLILALMIIGLVLLQRSEGGGLGIGGGGGLGNFASAGSTANALSKTTWILAACFFATSLTLGILAGTHSGSSQGILQELGSPTMPSEATLGSVSDGEENDEIPAAPIADIE